MNGEAKQQRKSVCVLKGVGTVVAMSACVVDYDEWEAQADDSYGLCSGLGKVEYRSCLVRFAGGEGWASEGALTLVK
jgi:hypothetical protein